MNSLHANPAVGTAAVLKVLADIDLQIVLVTV